MRTRIMTILAALLLSVSAFAQSGNNEPLKGDVNGDGTVDVADIAAIIEIMKNGGGTGEQTTYYWYAGQTNPSTMTTISGTADFNNGGGWTSLGNSVPETIYQLVKGFDNTKEIFVAVPITSGTTLKPVASDMSTIDTSVHEVSTKILNGVNYQIYTYGTGSTRKTIMFAKFANSTQTTYYWYVGQTQPTSKSSVTAQDSGTFTNNNWHTLNVNNTYSFSNPIYNSESNPISGDSNTYWYVALPADKSYGVYDSDDVNEVTVGNITKLSSTITVENVTYNIYKTVGTYRKFNGWWIH